MLILSSILVGGESFGDEEITLTVVHTIDMHSHLFGFSPNIAYTPETAWDDETVGGWARLAAVISGILSRETGALAVCDVFRAAPLGIGLDDSMGYPLISKGRIFSCSSPGSDSPTTPTF